MAVAVAGEEFRKRGRSDVPGAAYKTNLKKERKRGNEKEVHPPVRDLQSSQRVETFSFSFPVAAARSCTKRPPLSIPSPLSPLSCSSGLTAAQEMLSVSLSGIRNCEAAHTCLATENSNTQDTNSLTCFPECTRSSVESKASASRQHLLSFQTLLVLVCVRCDSMASGQRQMSTSSQQARTGGGSPPPSHPRLPAARSLIALELARTHIHKRRTSKIP